MLDVQTDLRRSAFYPCSSRTGLRRVPMPVISISTTSPGVIGPTPAGVPVETMSPGPNVIWRVMNSSRIGIGNIFSQGDTRSDRPKSVKGLAAVPAGFVATLEIALADIVHAGVPENVLESLLPRHVLAAVLDDKRQFGLVVYPAILKVIIV